jgi:hypothetical protein
MKNLLLLFISFISLVSFSQRRTYPTSITLNNGNISYCQNATATQLTITLGTFQCGSTGSNSNVTHTERIFVNTVNSNNGGTEVSSLTNSLFLTNATYTPSTTNIGILYYYAIVEWSTNGCAPTGTITSDVVSVEVLGQNSSIPFMQGFNGASCGWTTQQVNGTAGSITNVTSSTNETTSPSEGIGLIMFNSFSCTSGNSTRLQSPNLSVETNRDVEIKFDWRNSTTSTYSDRLDRVVVQWFNGTNWIDIETFNRPDPVLNGWQQKSCQFNTGNNMNIRIGFRFISAYGYNCTMDNLIVDYKEPPNPTSIISDNSIVCVGTTVTLNANGVVGNAYWFINSCGTTDEVGIGETINVTPNETTTYYVRNNNGLWSNECASITITVNMPNPTIIVGENDAQVGDFIWNGLINSDWNESGNWYVKTNTGYTLSTTAPNLLDNVFIVPSYIGGNCVSTNNTPIVNVLTLGSGNAHNVYIHHDSELVLDNNTILEVTGDFYSYGQLISGENSTVKFNGNDNTVVFITNPESNKLYNIEISKNNSNSEVQLESDIYVENRVRFESGNIRLNQLTLDLGSTGFFDNESENSYAYCDCPTAKIKRRILIPANNQINAGNLGLSIKPQVDMGYVLVERFHQKIEDPINNMSQSIVRYYSVKDVDGGSVENNGSLNAEIIFHYLNAELEGLNGSLSLFHKQTEQSFWSEYGGVHDPFNKTVTYVDFQSFSFVTLGPSGTALPVTLTSFTTNCNGEKVNINWTTSTEYNSSHYSLQNSRDGENWVEVAKIQSAGTTNQTTNYSYQDKSFGGISYYRLVQVDFDGQFEIFGPISVNCEIDINNIIIYPNPSSNTISIQMINQLDETMDLTILDFNGKIIFEKTISTQIIEQIDLKDYMNGVYIFIFSSLNQTYTTKIIKI